MIMLKTTALLALLVLAACSDLPPGADNPFEKDMTAGDAANLPSNNANGCAQYGCLDHVGH